jgi:hypothetical protein
MTQSATAAPEGSETVPTKVPKVDWAETPYANRVSAPAPRSQAVARRVREALLDRESTPPERVNLSIGEENGEENLCADLCNQVLNDDNGLAPVWKEFA